MNSQQKQNRNEGKTNQQNKSSDQMNSNKNNRNEGKTNQQNKSSDQMNSNKNRVDIDIP